uniref:Uncharacterized protein n=1 Tax=Arundo donax TaxID=35708 RepID=A0A0A8YEN0_ARUDO
MASARRQACSTSQVQI